MLARFSQSRHTSCVVLARRAHDIKCRAKMLNASCLNPAMHGIS